MLVVGAGLHERGSLSEYSVPSSNSSILLPMGVSYALIQLHPLPRQVASMERVFLRLDERSLSVTVLLPQPGKLSGPF